MRLRSLRHARSFPGPWPHRAAPARDHDDCDALDPALLALLREALAVPDESPADAARLTDAIMTRIRAEA